MADNRRWVWGGEREREREREREEKEGREGGFASKEAKLLSIFLLAQKKKKGESQKISKSLAGDKR